MNKEQLIDALELHHAEFREFMGSLSEADYLVEPIGKWSAGQQLDHICRSVGPVNMALGLPGFVLRLLFGSANRPSRTYTDLVEKYKAKLAAGGRASRQFVPGPPDWSKREKLLRRLERLVSGLNRKVERITEDQLDKCILPHPLLGKLTLREMLYFTIYHVQHHQQLVLKNLDKTA